MNEIGIDRLREAIVMKAVDDYCAAVKDLARMNMKEHACNKIIKQGYKKNEDGNGYYRISFTAKEAEEERLHRIKIIESRLAEVERFFFSDWCESLFGIDGQYLLDQTKEKAIDEMVAATIFDLSKITQKNLHTKKSQKALLEFEILKHFLYSEHLPRFTNRRAKDILRYIKSEVKSCVFSV